MSLIIPELSMPENCNECPCYYDGYCCAFEDSKNVDYSTGDRKRMDYCPLLEYHSKEQEPCEDCISRKAVLDKAVYTETEEGWSGRTVDVKDIESLPYVTPQPKIGHWVEENINEWSRKVFCSECGCPPPFEHVSNGDIYSASGYGVTNKTKFCPNCGAKMKEQE